MPSTKADDDHSRSEVNENAQRWDQIPSLTGLPKYHRAKAQTEDICRSCDRLLLSWYDEAQNVPRHRLSFKYHPIHYIVHYFLTTAHLGNRVAFGTHSTINWNLTASKGLNVSVSESESDIRLWVMVSQLSWRCHPYAQFNTSCAAETGEIKRSQEETSLNDSDSTIPINW